jgi:hypothetical protein
MAMAARMDAVIFISWTVKGSELPMSWGGRH